MLVDDIVSSGSGRCASRPLKLCLVGVAGLEISITETCSLVGSLAGGVGVSSALRRADSSVMDVIVVAAILIDVHVADRPCAAQGCKAGSSIRTRTVCVRRGDEGIIRVDRI